MSQDLDYKLQRLSLSPSKQKRAQERLLEVHNRKTSTLSNSIPIQSEFHKYKVSSSIVPIETTLLKVQESHDPIASQNSIQTSQKSSDVIPIQSALLTHNQSSDAVSTQPILRKRQKSPDITHTQSTLLTH